MSNENEKRDNPSVIERQRQSTLREGGDDALADLSPSDERADEKVIINTEDANRTNEESSKTFGSKERSHNPVK